MRRKEAGARRRPADAGRAAAQDARGKQRAARMNRRLAAAARRQRLRIASAFFAEAGSERVAAHSAVAWRCPCRTRRRRCSRRAPRAPQPVRTPRAPRLLLRDAHRRHPATAAAPGAPSPRWVAPRGRHVQARATRRGSTAPPRGSAFQSDGPTQQLARRCSRAAALTPATAWLRRPRGPRRLRGSDRCGRGGGGVRTGCCWRSVVRHTTNFLLHIPARSFSPPARAWRAQATRRWRRPRRRRRARLRRARARFLAPHLRPHARRARAPAAPRPRAPASWMASSAAAPRHRRRRVPSRACGPSAAHAQNAQTRAVSPASAAKARARTRRTATRSSGSSATTARHGWECAVG